MSEGIRVSSGSLVSVDTDLLRNAARRVDDAVARLNAAAASFAEAFDAQQSSPCANWVSSGGGLVGDTRAAASRADRIAGNLRLSADIYETVELTLAERSGTSDAATAARLAELYRAHPGMGPVIEALIVRWQSGVGVEVFRQFLGSSGAFLFGPVLWQAAIGAVVGLRVGIWQLDRGVIRNGTRVTGPVGREVLQPVTVSEVAPASSVAPPDGYADMVDRVPTSGDARVVVESYTGADGEPIAMVYVSGTRSDGPSDEAFGMADNLPAYVGGIASTSYSAVIRALEASGVAPGDRVVLSGYSQGAMLTEMIAASGEYQVVYAQSMGSPVEAEVDDSTTHMQFIHDDDPLVLARNGGLGSTSGTDGSAIVERTADPPAGLTEWQVPGHQFDEYRETAALADQSDDARLVTSKEVLRGLTDGSPGLRRVFAAAVDHR